MIDPADPGAGTFMWEGRWRTLTPAWDFDPKVENFALAWEQIEFPKLLRNTAFIAVVSTIGAVGSAICVAYGFSRFRFPRSRARSSWSCSSTIMLSSQVTLVPTVHPVHQDRLDRHLAAADRPALLRQCLQRVPAAPVLPDDPA